MRPVDVRERVRPCVLQRLGATRARAAPRRADAAQAALQQPAPRRRGLLLVALVVGELARRRLRAAAGAPHRLVYLALLAHQLLQDEAGDDGGEHDLEAQQAEDELGEEGHGLCAREAREVQHLHQRHLQAAEERVEGLRPRDRVHLAGGADDLREGHEHLDGGARQHEAVLEQQEKHDEEGGSEQHREQRGVGARRRARLAPPELQVVALGAHTAEHALVAGRAGAARPVAATRAGLRHRALVE
mmetsp:Transcript_6850/g.24358  ORF Transcript_6850/g.24358 Transcript_6850/m.24358 type:complete len:245 (-) Transcript_6850:3477-4211(-)